MPTIDNLRKSARRWLKALQAGDRDARARFDRVYPDVPGIPTLRQVQQALARERGAGSWADLVKRESGAPAPDRLTALLAAAASGRIAEIAALLDEDPSLVSERGLLDGHTGVRSALHFGVANEAVVRLLLERGADPNVRDEGDNAFPLHFAAEHENLPVIRLLLEHGADPIGDGDGHELQIIGWATCFGSGRPDVVEYLLAHGARHTVFSSVAVGDVAALRALTAAGADLNAPMDRTNLRRQPLHLAVVKRQPVALAALLELGADVEVEDAARLTPLDQAALDGERAMADQLLAAGAELRLPGAIGLDRTDDVARLLARDPDAVRHGHAWAQLILHASRRASGDVIDRLVAAGAWVGLQADRDVAVDDAESYTPLHAAAFHGNLDAVRALLRHGADPRIRDSKYCATPVGWADYAGHSAVRDVLLDADIDIFDAIAFDRGDRVAAILDRDPGALDRPFREYARCGARPGRVLPAPDQRPLEWAVASNRHAAAGVLRQRTERRTADEASLAADADTFLQFACWDGDDHGKATHRTRDLAAQRMLAARPGLARANLFTSIVCGEIDEVRRLLAARPDAASQPGGRRGWTPLLHLCYARLDRPQTRDNALAIARLLLDHGANPDDFYMAGGTPYTALVGAAAEGEQDAPRQPYAPALFDLLLERGARPFDQQVLYNTHFSGDVQWWLDLVYARTQGTEHEAAWRDPEWRMFDMGPYGTGARFLLWIALRSRSVALTEWVLSRGANPDTAPARDPRFSKGSVYQDAILLDLPEVAAILARYGADTTPPPMTPADRLRGACFRLDRAGAAEVIREHPDLLQSTDAMFAAAHRDRPDVIALLVDLGVPVNVRDRQGKRPLHVAAESNAVKAAAVLIERGAEIDARELNWAAPPIGFAAYGDHVEVRDLLSRYSRYVPTLVSCGYFDRVREVLDSEPALARQVFDDGTTLLWRLPDDEAAAVATARLLLDHGADASVVSRDGMTAERAARQRGLSAAADLIAAQSARSVSG